jgi:hypothetical protein
MDTLSVQHILLYGGLLCLVMGALVIGSLVYNARLWLQDYPAEVRAKVPPLSPTEKRQQRLFTIPFMLIMIALPWYSTHVLRIDNGGSISFLSAYLNTFFILNLFNLFDALVIDLLLALVMPSFMVLPGTEGMEYAYRNWSMHLRNYLKGIVIVTVFSLPITLAAMAW